MMKEWQRMFPGGMVLPQEWEYKDKDSGVEIVVDPGRALSYSLHKTGGVAGRWTPCWIGLLLESP